MMRLPAPYSNASSPLRQGGNERVMKTVHEVRRVASEKTNVVSAMKRLERSMSFTFLEGYAP